MAERAAHLVDSVFGDLPVRQWVLTLPHRLRYALAYDQRLCRAVLAVFVRAVLGFEQLIARILAHLGLPLEAPSPCRRVNRAGCDGTRTEPRPTRAPLARPPPPRDRPRAPCVRPGGPCR